MADLKEYITNNQEFGSVHISQDVIASISAHAAAEVEGVYALGNPETSERFGKKSNVKGIRLSMENDALAIECSVIAQYGYRVVELAQTVQENVRNAVESMTGLKVSAVDVNVCGIMMKK